MDVNRFKQKWIVASSQKESAAAQSHFLDLCALLNVPTPTEADPTGENYTFEKGATKAGGGDGYADVWYRGHFAIEYKGYKKDLNKAYQQVIKYKDALENPPLLVVCDLNTIRIHTNFTNTRQQTYEVTLADLDAHNAERGVSNLVLLSKMWTEPEWFRPVETADSVTIDAARRFSEIARGLHQRGTDPEDAAHFLVQMVFCLFAEDISLLPDKVFTKMIAFSHDYPMHFQDRCTKLLQAMNARDSFMNFTPIPYVNGGLFETVDVPELTKAEIGKIRDATEWDWSKIEPAIFGTLFERSLDPEKRSQLGAHYTSKADIQRVVDPVVIQPLRRRFAEVVQKHGAPPLGDEPTPKMTPAQKRNALKDIDALLHEIANATVLDPACGSGNFLYVALDELLTLELEVQRYQGGLLGTPAWGFSEVSPTQLRGIEINPIAQQLAQTSIWIGYLQWWTRNRIISFPEGPILSALDSIELKDALLTFHDDGTVTETEWPPAKYIIGNPPFLGAKRLRRELGDSYVEALFNVFGERIPGMSDFCCYFFELARAQLECKKVSRAGMLATNSIRGGASREVLKRIASTGRIYMAWSDESWILDGAAVRISIIGFDDGREDHVTLNGQPVPFINPDLTSETDIRNAKRLPENTNLSFIGDVKAGKFEIPGELAEEMLSLPVNVNGRPNSDVIRPWMNGMDMIRRPRNMHIIDFGVNMPMEQAAMYEAPFAYVEEVVKPFRDRSNAKKDRDLWWEHSRPVEGMRNAVFPLERFIGTPRVSKHRLFVWLEQGILADSATTVFAFKDDYFFGVLHSRAHELWSLRMGTWLGKGNDPRYTPTTTFETYPFPWPPGQEPVDDPLVQAIGDAAKALDDARNAWLNPAASPASGVATDAELKKRTLTNLYNANPTWLRNLHASLDRAVWDAYGWPDDETPADVEEDVILSRLLALNLERANGESS